MTSSTKTAFISHSSLDKVFVNRLISHLKDNGVNSLWYDYFDMSPTVSDINEKLKTGIKESDYFIIIISSSIESSQWVSYEIQHAIVQSKEVIAILIDSIDELYSLLRNPHINDLLKGGRHKIIDFKKDFDQGFNDLLIALTPNVGRSRLAEATVNRIIEAEDPDDAELFMSIAGLDPDLHLPLLLKHLPELRNDRKLKHRVSKALTYFREKAIDPVFAYLTLQTETPKPSLPKPDLPFSYDVNSGQSVFLGVAATDYIRYIILSGGNIAWSAQLGAQSCLVALAAADVKLYSIIFKKLETYLNEAIIVISSNKNSYIEDNLFDVLRLTIETVGLIGENKPVDAFFIHEFSTTNLWDSNSYLAKDKLSSYVVECLSRIKSLQALKYLLMMSNDEEIEELYIGASRHPNPWKNCFASFGAGAVDDLIKQFNGSSDDFKGLILSNLAQIPVPRAQSFVLNAMRPRLSCIDDILLSDALESLASTGLPNTCTEILKLYHEEQITPSNSAFQNSINIAVAEASVNANDKTLVENVFNKLSLIRNDHVQWYLIKAVVAQKMYRCYPYIQDLLDQGESGSVRAGAAIALSELKLIEAEEIINRLGYAERDIEHPYLSVALAKMGDTRAIPGLIHGLKHSFTHYNDKAHKWYAQALRIINHPDAEKAYKKWYLRI